MKYAMIVDGIVRNIARWDGVTPWSPGCQVVAILDGELCDIGWEFSANSTPRFTPPVGNG